jgi:hypothetical protein
MSASWMEDTHVADQNRNQGSKQADGGDGNFKSNPTDKEGQSAGERSASGMGGAGTGGTDMNKTKGSSGAGGSSGKSSAGGSRGSGSTGYAAGSKDQDEEDTMQGDEGLDEGEGGSSVSRGSKNL